MATLYWIMVMKESCMKRGFNDLNRTLIEVKRHWQLYVFLLLPLVYIIIFKYIPMLGLQIAFKDFTPTGGIWGSDWVGLKWFDKFFNSYQFTRVLKNTLVLAIYQLAASFPISILFALMLNIVRQQKFKKTVQTVTYIPHFISVVVVVGMMTTMFNPIIGVFGTIYQRITGELMPNILAQPSAFPHLYVWSDIWQHFGWNSIIYLAALTGVDPAIHEAAEIDGASRLKRVWYIDFPAILPTATIILIMNAGRIMNVAFQKVYLMQNPMNLSASEVISTYVYKIGLVTAGGNFSYATAIGLFNAIINLALILIVNRLARSFGKTSLW